MKVSQGRKDGGREGSEPGDAKRKEMHGEEEEEEEWKGKLQRGKLGNNEQEEQKRKEVKIDGKDGEKRKAVKIDGKDGEREEKNGRRRK
ncbi:hypothetical protein Pcinc_037302 [Petrolisthes cinctipes]|uniref:Uncharacterized protein n=1 Tax=Petrolisthes cinctipes TaxID=88211 RepID=A0AAE1BT38_PETCI|nr:hypothetical protein Pcinc_037302 [Petrolisthes cinctipes]